MSDLILLGAGASADADVPTAREMTVKIAEHLASEDRELADVLYFILGGLLLQQGMDGTNPLLGVDVEALLSAAELLSERRTLEAAPFVAGWNPMVEWLDRPEKYRTGGSVYRDDLHRKLEDWGRALLGTLSDRSRGIGRVRGFETEHLATEIVDTVRGAVTPGTGAMYRTLASKMTHALTQLVQVDDKAKVDYLSAIARLAQTRGRLVIATLNYDETLEWAAERVGVGFDTGIDAWIDEGTVSFSDDSPLVILKLHGSIGWVMEEPRWSRRPMPERRVRKRMDADDEWTVAPAIIFGQRNKLRVEGPFLDLLTHFGRALSEAARVTVIGYSFRDDHVNHYLSTWLNGDDSRTLRIVSRAFPAEPPQWPVREPPYVEMLRSLRERVEFVQGHTKDKLPSLTW